MSKFQRTYNLSVQGRSGTIYNFSEPLTLVFNTESKAASGIASARFMIYNISKKKRDDIQFDRTIDIDDDKKIIRRVVIFKAGYELEGYKPIVFQGNIKKAFSYREGPNVITDITVMDGLNAVQKAQVLYSQSFPWDPVKQAETIINTMGEHGVKLGAIGSLFDNLKRTRGVMWLGSAWDVLKQFSYAQGGCASIHKEKIYLMGPEDAIVPPGEIPQLDSSTGIIGTPKRSGWIVNADMVFEPRIQLWQKLKVKSSINPDINGTFRVDGILHRGAISEAIGGGLITSFILYNGPGKFKEIPIQ